MAKNQGKKFEEDFKASVPDDQFYYRFKDGTSSWDGGNARFQAKNICDCMIMGFSWLNMIELKSFKGKSFPFGNIDMKNLEELAELYKCKRSKVEGYVVFNFRDLERTFVVSATGVKEFIDTADRKSIPLSWFEDDNNEWQVHELLATKRRTRYRYDLSIFR